MQIVLFGATCTIGGAIAAQALARGHQVTGKEAGVQGTVKAQRP